MTRTKPRLCWSNDLRDLVVGAILQWVTYLILRLLARFPP